MSEAPAPAERAILTVSRLTALLKKKLRDTIGTVWVQGEVSHPYLAPQSGHLYFDLKDEENLVRCAIWRAMRAQIPFQIEHGIEIIALGTLDAYGPRSQYTLIVIRVEPVGRGSLQLRYEQLKARLEREGLFDPARKKPLPFLPRVVGVVTSIESAARHDIEETLRRRFPDVHLVFCDVRVQGEGAAEEIAAAIHRLNLSRPDIDVLIVGRGGGSLEDLWAFNEEVVARAIAASRIPVISAVGHETDFTIADFVADVRAKTPTEAGHLAVPDVSEVRRRMAQLADRMGLLLERRWLEGTRRADEYRRALAVGLRGALEGARQGPARLRELLPRALKTRLADARAALTAAARKLDPRAARASVREQRRTLGRLRGGMDAGVRSRLRRASDRLGAADGALKALSPLAVLARGYSITRDAATGATATDASKLAPGRTIESILHKGRLISRIEERRPPQGP
jgi:exodeoxyribonuclease VII large subunit